MLALATSVFLALRLLPGDPARLVLGDLARAEDVALLRHRLHLDEPMTVQYARMVRGLVTLELGESLRHPGVATADLVAHALRPTAALAAVAVAMGTAFGLTMAVGAHGAWLGRARPLLRRAPTVLAAFPLLSFAPITTYVLAARLRVVPLPGDPEAGGAGLAFAAALLALPLGAQIARVTTAALDGVARQPFVRVARAKGGSEARAWWIHALPAASGPVVTTIGAQLGALLGGAVVLERLFERPGLGTLILQAYSARDLPVLEASVVVTGALFATAQAVASAVHGAIDPRARR